MASKLPAPAGSATIVHSISMLLPQALDGASMDAVPARNGRVGFTRFDRLENIVDCCLVLQRWRCRPAVLLASGALGSRLSTAQCSVSSPLHRCDNQETVLGAPMAYQRFTPTTKLQALDSDKVLKLKAKLQTTATTKLKDLNAHWFQEPMGFSKTIPILLLVNLELTKRGIGPAWRAIPSFVEKSAPPPPRDPDPKAIWLLGDAMQRRLLKRWIDLEWLRNEIGPGHATQFRRWADAFSMDDDRAFRIFTELCSVSSAGANKAQVAPKNYQVLNGLAIPRFDRKSLEGLIDRDAGKARDVARKRVQGAMARRIGELTQRKAYPLTMEEAENRLVWCEAIELADGSPTNAARCYRWITGEHVSRQSASEMKMKLAKQLSLSRLDWR